MKKTQEKKYYYDWKQFNADCIKIAQWAKLKKLKNIYGIPRGGLVVAVKMSHILDIPIIFSVEEISLGTLVVDDIIDTGGTIERIFGKSRKKMFIASLYFRKEAGVKPDFYARIKRDWVVFPWETDRTSRYDKTI